MVRIRRLIAALGLAVLGLPVCAGAQALQRVSVESFVLSTDTASPHVDVPFHIVVTLRVREKIGAIDNLELPLLATLDLLGDERQIEATNAGSTYRETISVTAHAPGPLTIAPAVLQAIDARDGKAKQYSTNAISLTVVGVPSTGPLLNVSQGTSLRRALLWVALWVVVSLATIAVVVAIARRGSTADVRHAPPVVDEAPPLPQRTLHDQLRDALLVLSADPQRTTAIAVRGAVWRAIGADEGATLSAVLRLAAAADPALRALLIALERAAFTYDADLGNAIADARTALERAAQ